LFGKTGRIKMKRKRHLNWIIGLSLIFLFIFIIFNPSDAVTSSSQVNVSVQVATRTMIDVNPETIEWIGLEPGEEGGPDDVSNQNVNAPGSIQIENTGSTNITKIWFNVSQPSARPFGTGDNGSYDAGNFIAIAKHNTGQYYFVNRLDFNESQEIVYLYVPGPSWKYGRIRHASNEYFWAVNISANPLQNCGNMPLRIGLRPHNISSTGSTNFADGLSGTEYQEFTVSIMNANWGYVDMNSGPFANYCAIIPRPACDKIYIYHWDMDAPGAGLYCFSASYFWDNATNGELKPGESVIADIVVRVPYGVYQGYVKEGVLTVIAQSETST